MNLHKGIIREIARNTDGRGLTAEELSACLGASSAGVGGAVKRLLEKGLLASLKGSIAEGKHAPQRFVLGKDAVLMIVERVEEGFWVFLRSFDGAELQRKFLAKNHSMSREDDAEAAASSVFSYAKLFSASRESFALGVISSDIEKSIWKHVGADIVTDEDIFPLANKRSRATDLLVKIGSGVTEISVMRGGETINPRAASLFADRFSDAARLAELSAILDAENIIVSFEESSRDASSAFLSELRRECLASGARARVLESDAKTRNILLCEMLRDKICDKTFGK